MDYRSSIVLNTNTLSELPWITIMTHLWERYMAQVASYACFIHDLYIMADNIQSLAGYGSSDGVCSRELNDLIRFSFSITVLRIDNGWSSNA